VAAGTSALAQDNQQATAEAAPQSLRAEVKVCAGIADRMPMGEASSFGSSVGKVYVWSRITGGEGETTVKHVWSHNGVERASVELAVKGTTWRTWSAKTIVPSWTGAWEVKIIDAAGATLATTNFTIDATTTETAPNPADTTGR